MRRMYPLLIAALLALILAGCGANSTNNGNTNVQNTPLELPLPSTQGIESSATPSSEASPSPTEATASNDPHDPSNLQQAHLKSVAKKVVESLRERDLKSLAEWIDPEQGLRFSPYSHMDTDTDLVFKSDTLPNFKDTKKLKWGLADGSGEPIAFSFRDYYEKFVYNQDFADATNVSVNKIIGTGNVKFNGTSVYPNASYVEYHFPGFDKQFNGMDWQSLVLVFLPHESDWKLVAIVHGQWTI
jgi:uncharacterized protein YcfL